MSPAGGCAGQPPLVVHVIHHLFVGGMENGLVNLINHMPADAFRHAVVCIEDFSAFRQRIRNPDVPVVALHRSRIGVWGVRREIFRLCRQWRPTLVHSRNMSGLDALLPSWLAGVPHRVHSEHGWDVANLHGANRKAALLRRLHSPLVSRYITVSRDLQRYLVERVGIAERRIEQIYNGVDTERFHPGGTPMPLPAGFAGEGIVRIGTVGRVQAVKDQATLVKAFAALLARRPDWRARARLMVVGDGPLLEALRDLVRSLGLDDQVWLPGASTQVAEHMAALDLYVLPSLNEGISNTVLEAMASGLPVLCTAVGGNVELVRDGVDGRHFQPGDVAALSAALEAYLDDPALRSDHGRAARQSVQERFSLQSMVRRYGAVYEGLCRG